MLLRFFSTYMAHPAQAFSGTHFPMFFEGDKNVLATILPLKYGSVLLYCYLAMSLKAATATFFEKLFVLNGKNLYRISELALVMAIGSQLTPDDTKVTLKSSWCHGFK
jgi:hypothetical protein